VLGTRKILKYHPIPPHPDPPLEGEESLTFSPFKGEIKRGMGYKTGY